MAGPNRKRRGACSPEIAAAISAILSMSGAAAAQTPESQQAEPSATAPAPEPEPVEEGGLNEVIVTATKRSERLQDVPESISAFDSTAIAIRGLKQMDDYARLVPGLSISDREPGGTTIVFRGVASSGLQFGAVSSSALYLDEQPITQSGRDPDPRLIDIERVEALRGPQGTLYGASSQSGTLRIITNKPNPREFSAWGDAQLSRSKSGGTSNDVSAMVNIPLAEDRIALRLVGFTAKDAGFIDNVLGTSPGGTFTNADLVDKDVNSTKVHGGRAALRFDVNENFDATLTALFQDTKAHGHGDTNAGDPDVGSLEQVRFSPESLDDKWYQTALTLNAKTPIGDAVLSASYFNRKFRYEADATEYEFIFDSSGYVIYDFGGDPRGFATNRENTHITTVEARLGSPSESESRWSWIVGGFYSQEKGHTEFDSYVRGYADTPAFEYFSDYETRLTGNPLNPTDRWFLGIYDTELDQVAAFGELSFDVTEKFEITAGGRYFDYDRRFKQIQESPEGFSGATKLDGNQKTSENGTVWKANLNYKIDRNRLLYATYSEGFRVGGSNPLKPASVLPRNYKSDTLQNFELGAKTEWFQRRLRLNLSAYYMKWNDFAVQIEDPQEGVFQLGFVNLPTAEIPGVEADFAVTVTDQLTIDGTVSWNDAKIAEATSIELTDPDGIPLEPFIVAKNSRLPLTADWTANLGFEYRPEVRWVNAKPYVRFDYSYVGGSVNSLEGIESVVSSAPVTRQPAYKISDLRMGLEGEHWSGALFVDNIANEHALIFANNRWGGIDLENDYLRPQRRSVNRPRTIGIQFRYDF